MPSLAVAAEQLVSDLESEFARPTGVTATRGAGVVRSVAYEVVNAGLPPHLRDAILPFLTTPVVRLAVVTVVRRFLRSLQEVVT